MGHFGIAVEVAAKYLTVQVEAKYRKVFYISMGSNDTGRTVSMYCGMLTF